MAAFKVQPTTNLGLKLHATKLFKKISTFLWESSTFTKSDDTWPFMLEACKGNLLNNDIMTCDLCWTFEDILWESSTFTKSDDTWLFMLEACKANLLNK
jgi:uncharacterized protein YchJ